MNCRLFAMTLSYGGAAAEWRIAETNGEPANNSVDWNWEELILFCPDECFSLFFLSESCSADHLCEIVGGKMKLQITISVCLGRVSFRFILVELRPILWWDFFLSLLWPQNGYCQTDRHWSGGVSEWLELFVATLDRKKTDGEWFTGTELCNMKDWWDVGIEGRSIMEGGVYFSFPYSIKDDRRRKGCCGCLGDVRIAFFQRGNWSLFCLPLVWMDGWMDDDGREQNEKRLIIHWTVSGCFFSCLLLSLLLLLLLTCHLSRCHCWLAGWLTLRNRTGQEDDGVFCLKKESELWFPWVVEMLNYVVVVL